MKRILLTSILAAGFAAPALAQSPDTMSCEDFSAMSEEEQMSTMEEAQASGEATAEDDQGGEAMTTEDRMAAAAEACDAHPDMSVGAAMKAEQG